MDLGKLLSNIKPEHLIAMAVAFIFLVSACASLIISANNKIDRISSRFRCACESWRELDTNSANFQIRREYLGRQIRHFYVRYEVLQKVQKIFFITICLFIGAYFFYIFASVFAVINMSSQDSTHPPTWLQTCIIVTLGLMTGLFIVGIGLMLRAAYLQVRETANSHETLRWECKDILDLDGTSNNVMHPTADTNVVI